MGFRDYITFNKGKIYLVGGVAILALVAFAFGRYLSPTKTVVTEKAVEVEKQVVVEKVVTQVKIVKVADNKTNTHTVEHDVKKADGTEDKTVTTDTSTQTEVKTDTDAAKQADKTATKTEYKIVERTVFTETAKPSWHVGVLGGVTLTEFPAGGWHVGPDRLVLGGEVDHRFIGPVSLGAWGLTSGQVGVKLGLEF